MGAQKPENMPQKAVAVVVSSMLLAGMVAVVLKGSSNMPSHSSVGGTQLDGTDISLPKVDINHQDLEQSDLTCPPKLLTELNNGMSVAAPYIKQLVGAPLDPVLAKRFFGEETAALLGTPGFRNDSLVHTIIQRAAIGYAKMNVEWKPACCDTDATLSTCTLDGGCTDKQGKSISVGYACSQACSDGAMAFVISGAHEMNSQWLKAVKNNTAGDVYAATTNPGEVHFCPYFFQDKVGISGGFAIFHELVHLYGGVDDSSLANGLGYVHSSVESVAKFSPLLARNTAQNYVGYAAAATLKDRKDIEAVWEGNDLCTSTKLSTIQYVVDAPLCQQMYKFQDDDALGKWFYASANVTESNFQTIYDKTEADKTEADWQLTKRAEKTQADWQNCMFWRDAVGVCTNEHKP